MYKKQPDSDQAIIDAVHDDNSIGWELLFTKYDPMIRSITRWPKWHFPQDEQEDVYQNIHMHLLSAVPTFRQQSSLSWFIKKIAIRQCINEIRRQKRWRTVITPLAKQTTDGQWNEMEFANANDSSPYDKAVQHERLQHLQSALQQLQKTCRESINMFYLQQLSYKEMSSKLGISINTVGSRLSKCLDKLHQAFRRNITTERNDS